MASIRHEIRVDAPASEVWDAVRDVGEVHRRLCPGVLTDARMDGDARVVTFANGLVVRELIVDIDDARRRFAYAATGGRTLYHHAAIDVVEDGPTRSRIVWVIDMLPDELAPSIDGLMKLGAEAMKRTLEAR